MKTTERNQTAEELSVIVHDYFSKMDFDGLSIYLRYLQSQDQSGLSVTNFVTCVELFSKILIEEVFCEQQADRIAYFHSLMAAIPMYLCKIDYEAAKMLLIPVRLVVESEFDDVTQSREQLEDFYARTNILNIWPRMHPRIWSLVAHAYGILDEVIFTIQQECKNGDGPLGLREKVNRYLMGTRTNPNSSLGEFSLITAGLPDIWDLVDIELFIAIYPDELRLSSTCKRMYKPSFARKIAMATIVRFVNEHQQQNRRLRSQLSEQVVECCKAANLDLIATSEFNKDALYFLSHIKRGWLVSATRSSCLRIDEIYDHIQADDSLVDLFFSILIDDERCSPALLAELVTCHEKLRTNLIQKRQFVDDPIMRMLISVIQGGRRECWIDLFGPKKLGAFVLPPNFVSVIDTIDGITLVQDHIASLGPRSVVAIDLFFQVWRDVVLEKPVPNVVAIASDSQVFLIMTHRLVDGNMANRIRIRNFLKFFLEDPKILKITPSWQFGGKFHSLVALWADDAFELDNMVCQTGTRLESATIGPCYDICRKILIPPLSSFADTCERMLGITVCEFEANSNWSNSFLRNSQLHYIAVRSWLTIQIFHADTDIAKIRPHLTMIDLNKLSAPGMYTQWRGADMEMDAWIGENRERNENFKQLVESTQTRLWETLERDLRNDSSLTCDTSTNIERENSYDLD